MAVPSELKKPTSAYWLWLSDNRDRIASMLGNKKGSEVAKKGGELWKAISEADKAPYDKKAAEQKAAYEKFIATDEGKKALSEKKATQADAKADKNDKLCKSAVKAVEKDESLKKPTSAYWLWLSDNREKISAVLGTKKVPDVAKKGGEMWKELGVDAKSAYETKAKEQKEAYDKYVASDEGLAKLKAFKDATQAVKDQFKPKEQANLKRKNEASEADKDATSPVKTVSPKTRAKASNGTSPPAAKRGKTGSTGSEGPVIAPDLLKQAEAINMAGSLRNIAARQDIVASGKSHEEMLEALKSNGGLVNKAKAALLGA